MFFIVYLTFQLTLKIVSPGELRCLLDIDPSSDGAIPLWRVPCFVPK